MTKITQIEDKGATIAWSPSAANPDLIALGTKVCLLLNSDAINEPSVLAK